MRPGYDPAEEAQKVDKTTPFERGLLSLSVGAIVFAMAILAILAIRGCNAHGQDAPVMLGVEIQYDTNVSMPALPSQVRVESATLWKRPAQPVVPAIMPPQPMPSQPITSRVVITNGSKRVTITEQDISPAPLVQDRPRTNSAFWVMCPNCTVRAIRAPLSIQTNGVVTIPDGDQIERTIYFRCCSTEFKARNFKFVETPIAEEVTVPVK